MKWVTPTCFRDTVQQIDLTDLKARGIRLVMLDIDNTLVPTSTPHSPKEIDDWLRKVKQAGFDICFVSNNSKKRVDTFNSTHGLFRVYRAAKPLGGGFRKAMAHFGVTKAQTCMVGDQLLTDVLGANLAGIFMILVTPLSTDEGKGIHLKRRWERSVLKKIQPKKFGLIGNPVGHSRSPVLHTAVYKEQGINAQYNLFEPKPHELAQQVAYFKHHGYSGFNITVPYKADILPFLDEISPQARKLGVVNTVHIKEGKLIGYNTDGEGFALQVTQNGIAISHAQVKIIGAGGATPSIVNALLLQGAAHITLYNRTVEKAQAIAAQYDAVTALPLSDFTATHCDILINTTSVGLDSTLCPVPDLAGIRPETAVFDLIYSPRVTTFLDLARQAGCPTFNGYEMLIYQGLIADEIWFETTLDKQYLCGRILRLLEKGERL